MAGRTVRGSEDRLGDGSGKGEKRLVEGFACLPLGSEGTKASH